MKKSDSHSILIRIFGDIRFWVVLFFLIRLVGISNPPLEFSHNWRQVTGLMVARNLLEINPNLFFPRVEGANGDVEIIGMEFPLLNYGHMLLARFCGYQHWFGRFINLFVSTVGVFYFFKIIQFWLKSSHAALFSSILLCSSIWFSFSRKMMPDTFSISLVFTGLWCGILYYCRQKSAHLLLFFFMLSIGLLAKIPSILYLIPFLVIISIQNGVDNRGKKLLVAASFSTLICLIWYLVWCPKLSIDYQSWFNSGKSFSIGFKEVLIKYKDSLHNFTFHAFQGYAGFFLFIAGVLSALFKKEKKLLLFLMITGGGFLLFIFKAGWFFYHHNYYIIPFVPAMAILGGYALSLIKRQWMVVLILSVCVLESVYNQVPDFFVSETEEYKLTLEKILDGISSRDDRIITNGNGNPQMLYLAHRKGWSCVDWEITELRHIQKVADRSCKFIVIDRHASDELDKLKLPLKSAFENDDFRIYHTSFEKSGLSVWP